MRALKGLRVASDLVLPLDAATGTFGILATKGSGKSNAAVVMAETMHAAGIPWVAVDPKGDWWGVRSSADGDGPGLPVVVFGGRHGDVPLEPTAGVLVAQLVLDQRLSCVLDVSQFTKADTVRFLLAFGQHLFRHADDHGAEPLHLFLEEAHEYLPQQVTGDVAQLVNAWQRIVKQGRFKGLGCTLISQRSSSLNKDVLELVDTLIVLRTIGPRSRAAIKSWVDGQDVDAGLLASLPTLADGEAWVWSPGELRIMQRIQFLRRSTFDSGATPKVGQPRRAPATLADVDLAAISAAMAETIERAKAEDPKVLRAMIRQLERELAERPAAEVVEVEVVREVPVIDSDARAAIEEVAAGMRDAAAELVAELARVVVAVGSDGGRRGPHPAAGTAGTAARPPVPRPAPPERPQAPPRREAGPLRSAAAPDAVHVKAGARRMLVALARSRPVRVTRPQLGLLAGIKHTGGTFSTYWSTLRKHGLIDLDGDLVSITQAGLDLIDAPDVAEPQTTEEILDRWRAGLKRGARDMLDVVVKTYPAGVSREDLAEQVGIEVTGGTFSTYLGTLRRNGLVEVDGGWVTAAEVLFP